MIRIRMLVGLALAPALLLAGCASTDGDGRTAAENTADRRRALEAEGARRQLFISPAGEPFRAAPGAPDPMATWFAQADADHDGRLTLAEFTADAERFFNTLDKNHDGVVDGFEAQDYERDVAPELLPQIGRLRGGEGQDERLFNDRRGGVDRNGRGADRARMGAGGGAASRGGASAIAYQLFPDPQPITSADRDLDGRVTLAEWRLKVKAAFAQLDSKGQGYLTLAGLPKTPMQQFMDRRRAAETKARPRTSP
jgi:hypothetical protein